jgi:hypothetical protein
VPLVPGKGNGRSGLLQHGEIGPGKGINAHKCLISPFGFGT